MRREIGRKREGRRRGSYIVLCYRRTRMSITLATFRATLRETSLAMIPPKIGEAHWRIPGEGGRGWSGKTSSNLIIGCFRCTTQNDTVVVGYYCFMLFLFMTKHWWFCSNLIGTNKLFVTICTNLVGVLVGQLLGVKIWLWTATIPPKIGPLNAQVSICRRRQGTFNNDCQTLGLNGVRKVFPFLPCYVRGYTESGRPRGSL